MFRTTNGNVYEKPVIIKKGSRQDLSKENIKREIEYSSSNNGFDPNNISPPNSWKDRLLDRINI